MNIDSKKCTIGAGVGGSLGIAAGLYAADKSGRNSLLSGNYQYAKCTMRQAKRDYIKNSLEADGIKTLQQFCDTDEFILRASGALSEEKNKTKKIQGELSELKKALSAQDSTNTVGSIAMKKQIKELSQKMPEQSTNEHRALKGLIETVEERKAHFFDSYDGKIYKDKAEFYTKKFQKTTAYKTLQESVNKTKKSLMLERSKWVAGFLAAGILVGIVFANIFGQKNTEKIKKTGAKPTFA